MPDEVHVSWYSHNVMLLIRVRFWLLLHRNLNHLLDPDMSALIMGSTIMLKRLLCPCGWGGTRQATKATCVHYIMLTFKLLQTAPLFLVFHCVINASAAR